MFKVDSQKLFAHITILQDQKVIAKFVDLGPNPQGLEMQLQAQNYELRGNNLSSCTDVGKGYFLLSSNESIVIHKALMLSPFKTKWGTCMLPSWAHGFDLDNNPSNLAFPHGLHHETCHMNTMNMP